MGTSIFFKIWWRSIVRHLAIKTILPFRLMAAVYLKGYILPLISEYSDREVESYKTMSICLSIDISPTNETTESFIYKGPGVAF